MMINFLKKLGRLIDAICLRVLAISVLILIVFTVVPIFLRSFNISFSWIDVLVRHIVFFNIFTGSILATAKGNHITIDILAKFFEKAIWYKRYLVPLVYLMTGAIVSWLAYAAICFAQVETQFSRELFFGVQSSQMAWAISIGFTLLALRFFIAAFEICHNSFLVEEKNWAL